MMNVVSLTAIITETLATLIVSKLIATRHCDFRPSSPRHCWLDLSNLAASSHLPNQISDHSVSNFAISYNDSLDLGVGLS
ncbi:hypothetical protein TIFTF001_009918 [Ficus carica]|uniref:Secreted protein n=1 Tax=Ficus carica TaxID=3494 RepID=A0AA88DHK8_FICCA|nr:hypothetical protein TIFTF001_009918 [Ficus carica]